jgi:hypothetical protein
MLVKLGTLRELLNEVAATPDASAAKGLALYRFWSTGVMQVVIYDPSVLMDVIHDQVLAHKAGVTVGGTPRDMEAMFRGIKRHVIPVKFIKGMLTFAPPDKGECYGGWTVRATAAEKGFGPLVYDIAMGVAPNSTLIPDRKSTSKSAGSVWQYYKNKRADIKAMPLDDMDNPRTKPKYDDCQVVSDDERPWLDFAYQGLGAVDTGNLERNHKNVLWVTKRVMKDNDMPSGDVRSAVEELIGDVADASFFSRFLGGF